MIVIRLTSDELAKIEDYLRRYHAHAREQSSYGHWYHSKPGKTGGPNRAGLSGEVAIVKWLGRSIDGYLDNRPKWSSDQGWDISINGIKYDVKTQQTKYMPKPSYLCNVIKEDYFKSVDGYIFLFKRSDKEFVYVGYISKEEFDRRAIFKEKGELGMNRFRFHHSCYTVPICSLKPPETVRKT